VLFIARSTPSFPDAADAHGPFSLLNRALAHPLPNIPDGTPFADCVAAVDGAEDDGGDEAAGEKGGAAASATPAGETAPDAEGTGGVGQAFQSGADGTSSTAAADTRSVEAAAKGAGRIVVASQPRGQACAVVGGIMATRLHRLGARGLCVDGRVRDLASMTSLGLPVRFSAVPLFG
jgi:hypothetical protein